MTTCDANRRRILVVLHETGSSASMARRSSSCAPRVGGSHRVDRPDKRGRSSVPDHAGPDVVSLGALPDIEDRWISTLRAALDYCRYLEAPFGGATYLRRRWEKILHSRFRFLTRIPRLPRAMVGLLIRSMRALDGSFSRSADSDFVRYCRGRRRLVVRWSAGPER